ncbi:MAG: hypothetical protein AB1758_18545 [Candidatus Eremiobacterota bacterium]
MQIRPMQVSRQDLVAYLKDMSAMGSEGDMKPILDQLERTPGSTVGEILQNHRGEMATFRKRGVGAILAGGALMLAGAALNMAAPGFGIPVMVAGGGLLVGTTVVGTSKNMRSDEFVIALDVYSQGAADRVNHQANPNGTLTSLP